MPHHVRAVQRGAVKLTMPDFVQAHHRELVGVGFVALLPSKFLGVEVMARDLAVERALAEGARDRLRVSHMISLPFILIGRAASARLALPRDTKAFQDARP
jgi:hypothetical protein